MLQFYSVLNTYTWDSQNYPIIELLPHFANARTLGTLKFIWNGTKDTEICSLKTSNSEKFTKCKLFQWLLNLDGNVGGITSFNILKQKNRFCPSIGNGFPLQVKRSFRFWFSIIEISILVISFDFRFMRFGLKYSEITARVIGFDFNQISVSTSLTLHFLTFWTKKFLKIMLEF